MADVWIKIDTSIAGATQAALLKQFVAQERAVYELGVRIRAQMSNMNNGSQWGTIETQYGLPTGKGATVYDLVNGTIGAMEGTFTNNNGKTLGELIG